ncbi:hypothetical protein H4219_004359 [Mycoemilia scoparia]|uniref:RING-type E3 ubiquitin transferase n=1 Tax=Mycoemilia scoparia TaxID=417184 RepID=A0A9W7ZXR3_9FUNG|nr:hypothetical protein H4219_004359 [Mycoemilia scoparia]
MKIIAHRSTTTASATLAKPIYRLRPYDLTLLPTYPYRPCKNTEKSYDLATKQSTKQPNGGAGSCDDKESTSTTTAASDKDSDDNIALCRLIPKNNTTAGSSCNNKGGDDDGDGDGDDDDDDDKSQEPGKNISTTESENQNEVMCSICLDIINPSTLIRQLPCCHFFHRRCIDQALTSLSATCPLCKFDVYSYLYPPISEPDRAKGPSPERSQLGQCGRQYTADGQIPNTDTQALYYTATPSPRRPNAAFVRNNSV